MAENEPEKTEATEEKAAGKGKSPKMLIVILLAVVLAGGGFFGMKIMGAGKKKVEAPKVGKVMQLKEFLVNLADQQTFLRTEIALGIAEKAELKAHGEGKEEKEGGDDPQIRDAIIMLLSSKRPSELSSLEGKESLKREIISKLNQILGEPHKQSEEKPSSADKHTDSPEKKSDSGTKKAEENHGPVLEVYFTSFATQKY